MALNNKISKEDFLTVFRDGTIPTLLEEKEKHEAEKNFLDLEFPTKSDEEWRHTSINKLLQHRFGLGKTAQLDKKTVDLFTIPGLDAYRLVFINGYYNAELSDELEKDGKIVVKSSANAKKEHANLFEKYYQTTEIDKQNFFTNLNTTFATNGSFVYIPDNEELDKPVHVINFSDGQDSKTISQYRNIFYAGKNSKVQIVNSFHSLTVNYTLTNALTEVILDENAHLNFNIFQGEGDDAFQVNHTKVLQHRGSNFSSHTITLCGALVRNDLHVKHLAEACETNLNGLYLPDREQHFDNHLFVHHATPHCTSNQLYKGIIDNKASAVFLGKVLVDRGAQKTLANQSNRNVLLTKYAKVNSKPQLEIYADDVACSHGSTTGQIDKEALFYLQSRGINRRQAETLLLNAFLSDVIENIQVEPLKILTKLLIDKRLKGEKVEGQCSMIEACHGCDPID